MARTKNYKDLTGLKFGRWSVIQPAPSIFKYNKSYLAWECICECGNSKIMQGSFLRSGGSKSCGCLKIEVDKTREMLPFGESAFNRLYDWSRDNAKRKGILFELTKEQYKSIVQHNCTYCGEPPKENHFKKTNGHFMANGVDRVDSSVGYVLNNCVPCCEDCNRMKMAHTVDYWLAHMIKVLEHYNSRNRVSVIKSVPIKNN